ncbi:hypothetical protein C2G38_2160854 [Gigaspora rosea]|uniref:Uncharacterized protein n=1 Tax=Gigaspora rosea TaxID=44941 RepID=A0A397VXV7_9GLOM|nr:hypothetical protein C2G38_2160854 [Gigaspora rosea]
MTKIIELEKDISSLKKDKTNLTAHIRSLSMQLLNQNISEFFGFGIMADESTCDILRCNASTISSEVLQICNETSINPKNCHFWLTDNTAYMASKATFGKADTIKGLSLKKYPYNALYLAFYLHDGYDLSDKDSPLNLKSNIIRNLYKAVFNYELTKYQQPIQQRWLYELKAAKQYLSRIEIHKQFAPYFLEKLNKASNVPKSYIQKWKIFNEWINDIQLTLQIKCLVKFGEEFYKPFYQFFN